MPETRKFVLLLLLVFLGLPMLKVLLFQLNANKVTKNLPYHRKQILTKPEYRFYLALRPVLASYGYIICPKVGLKDIFEVNKGTKDREKFFRKISQKHVDFVICDGNLRPLFAIELDDNSHKRAEVKERDAFKDALFERAGFPLYRIPVSTQYTAEAIKHALNLSDDTSGQADC